MRNDWKSMMPAYKHQFMKIENLFGEVDATTEWQNPSLSASEFYDSQSYNDFTQNDVLFVFGGRGTGKTAFLKMMNYDVCNEKYKKILSSRIIDKQKSYSSLTSGLRGSPLSEYPINELVPVLTDKWKWVIIVGAMSSVYEHIKKPPEKYSDDVKLLGSYLKDQGLIDGENSLWDPIDKVVRVLTDNFQAIDYEPTKVGLAIAKTFQRLKNPDYDKALRSFTSILRKEKKYALVLIDSMEVYNLEDKIGSSAISALISAALDLYNTLNTQRILVKIAFQSEIYNQISQLNPGKSNVRELIILWHYKDIVCLLAKRF